MTARHQKNNNICLIYVLRNHVNNKVYVGQTWRALKERFRTYRKSQPHLFNAIEKYGKDNFYYEVLTIALTQEVADYWEGYFITKYDSTNNDKGYNIRGPGGSRGKFSQISKDKMSARKLGIPLSKNHKQHLSDIGSGEDNPAAKITSEIAREIYLDFLNNKISISELSNKYKLTNTSISAILNRKNWQDATKDLPDIDMFNKVRGSYYNRSNLTEELVYEIKLKFQTGLYTQKQLTQEYDVSSITIHEIVRNKTWKHVKI
jgi:group I intron endonuclease